MADRECLQLRSVLVVVVVAPGVHPAQRAGVGHRGEEGEPVGPGGGRDVVAAAEPPVRQRASGGDDPVDRSGSDPVTGIAQPDPIEEAGDVLSRCRVPGQLDRDRASTSQRPQGHAAQVPLVRVHRLGDTLGDRVEAIAELIDHAVLRCPGTVVEDHVDGDVAARVPQLVVQPVADHVRQLGLLVDDHVELVQEHAVHTVEQRPVQPARCSMNPAPRSAVESDRVRADEPVTGHPVIPVGRT